MQKQAKQYYLQQQKKLNVKEMALQYGRIARHNNKTNEMGKRKYIYKQKCINVCR